jgi:hypothetical protein
VGSASTTASGSRTMGTSATVANPCPPGASAPGPGSTNAPIANPPTPSTMPNTVQPSPTPTPPKQ